MSNMMDWILSKMNLLESEEEYQEPEPEIMATEKSWLELVYKKKEKVMEEERRIFFKIVQSYADCKQVIENYRDGAVCVYSLEPSTNPDAQGMMNYICGGLYALDSDVSKVGENVFMTRAKKEDTN